MSLRSIRDSIAAKFIPHAKSDEADKLSIAAIEQKQIEVQEMDTDAVRNNYLMRDYIMSLPEEERQRYIEAQNGNPAIEEYKKSIGLDKNIGLPADESAPLPKPNGNYYHQPDDNKIIAPQKAIGSLLHNKE